MSRIAWLCGLGLMAAVVPARGDVPATRPADAPTIAATIAPPIAAALPSTDVYLTPFHPLTDAPDWAWVGRAVEHNLAVDLLRTSRRSTAADTDADPHADPLAAARSAGARYSVTGTYQWVDPKLRLDAQVFEVATGNVVGVLSATGDGRDLFGLEDDLSAQLARTLAPGHPARSATTRPVPPALQPEALAAMVAPPAAGVGSAYAGSALQSYLDGNRSPAVDYAQQLVNARQQNTFASYDNYGGPDGQGYVDFGGYGYGAGYGYGYGGGGYLLGVSYPIAGGGPFGYGGYGGGGGFGRGGGYRGTFAGGRGSIGVGIGTRGGFAGGRGGFR